MSDKFIIDRSDSVHSDYVDFKKQPSVTIIKGHKVRSKDIGADKWVDTYEKFLNTLFVTD